MQTLESVKTIVANCSFNDWTFFVGLDPENDNRIYVQVLFKDKDRITGEDSIQRCRKWYLSAHMVNSEVVRTAFKAVEAAVIHETQEAFKYRGVRVYNPHMDLDALADAMLAGKVGVSLREDNGYMPTVKVL